jgi:hypothetical protein
MVTVGSISRAVAAAEFEFLAESYRGRRNAIRELTHTFPELVFWVSPDGRLLDARDAHRKHPPPGHEWILRDEPDYGGFLRGRIARAGDRQLVVIYCRPEALGAAGPSVRQLVRGLSRSPVPIDPGTLVISDNGDLYGTYADLIARSQGAEP